MSLVLFSSLYFSLSLPSFPFFFFLTKGTGYKKKVPKSVHSQEVNHKLSHLSDFKALSITVYGFYF